MLKSVECAEKDKSEFNLKQTFYSQKGVQKISKSHTFLSWLFITIASHPGITRMETTVERNDKINVLLELIMAVSAAISSCMASTSGIIDYDSDSGE